MIRLYGSSLSPFVRKTLVFATEKGLAYELHPAGSRGKDPAFYEASPFRKIPALKHGDFLISDSSAIVAYFEALQPEPNLIPLEAKARARTIWFDEFADTIVFECVLKIFVNRVVAPRLLGREGDLAAADEAQRTLFPRMVDYLESVVPPSGYLVEDRLTLADIAVGSVFATIAHGGCAADPATHPKAAAYLAGIHARPAFSRFIAEETAMLAA
jgi:glutathione S-transferase